MCGVGEHQEWRSAPGPSSSTSMLVSDLLPSTEYQFSVMAHNKLGSGPFSNITTARTMGQNQLLLPLLTSSRSSFSLSGSICLFCILISTISTQPLAQLVIFFFCCFLSRRTSYIIQAGAAHVAILQPEL